MKTKKTEYIISVATNEGMKKYCTVTNEIDAIGIAKLERKNRAGSIFVTEVKTEVRNVEF